MDALGASSAYPLVGLPFPHIFKIMQNIVVRQPSDLTIAWAQRVVNKHYSHIVVSNVDIVSVDIGTTTRIRVNVGHNDPTILPGQWFVKLPSIGLASKDNDGFTPVAAYGGALL
jgi:hypothetical protein